jgi:hypothetical protein
VLFPEDAVGRSEPLVVSGAPGEADFLYVQYLDGGRIRLGYDHWGAGGPLSDPLTIPSGAVQEMVVNYGGLMPPPGHALYRSEPQLEPLRTRLYVALNGETVFNQPARSHPNQAESVRIGVNAVGGSSCATDFRGRVSEVQRLEPSVILVRSGEGAGR